MLQHLKSNRDRPRANIIALFAAVCLYVAAVQSHAEQTRSRITWDAHSLKIDEERIFVWGGEMHPFRLPSPSLWRDVLEKMKASGYNTVAFYFAWGYHSPKQGVYDFSGVRDMDRLLRMAKEVGLYVIVRPGPYMNAEVTRGGFPSWLVTQAARARTDAPEYLNSADEWLTQINSIIKRHQLTDGGGNVILYQIENELDLTSPAHQRYMQHLYDKVRSDGITVPIFHNDKGRNGYWVPASSKVAGVVHGPVDLYAFDAYPGGSCNVDATPGIPNIAPDFGLYGAGGAKGGASASPTTPGFTAEFGGGWFDYWGSNDTYPCTAIRNGPGYQRVFYGTNIANALTIQSFYMTFGGTSWGWLPAPVVFTSYDYGAAIDEARRLRDKARTMKQLGQFIEAVKPLRKMRKGGPTRASTPAVKIYHNLGRAADAAQDAHIYVAMHEPSNATTNDTFRFPIESVEGRYVVPQQGTLQIAGQDAKILLASYDMERQRLVYSTSELQTHLRLDDHDLALLYGRRNEDGETVLRFETQPRVEILSGSLSHTFDAESGDLRLNYTHDDLLRARISEGRRAPLMLLIAAEDIAQTFWRQDTNVGAVIERGPALVRSASIVDSRLDLRGDTNAESELEIWAPARVKTVTWNGKAIPVKRTNTQSLLATRSLAGASAIDLPDLSRSTWKFHRGSPEADPGFDDSGWRIAELARTNGPTKPPAGQPVLTMDDYGFHHGDVWYRGRYAGNQKADTLTLHWGGGGAGLIQVWIDGVFVAQDEHATGLPRPPTTGATTIRLENASALPTGQQEHVIAVMVRNNSHNWDLDADDAHKEGRGLISASLSSSTGKSFSVPIRWKIQGHLGAERLPDPTRGPLNNGGSHGERMGWHLPGFTTDDWSTTASIPDRQTRAGTSWYRTDFDLAVPIDHDASIGLSIGDRSALRSRGRYRALIFLNGWNVGQFIAHVGPQRTFVLPNGILNPRGRNTLALAVTSDGGPESYLERVELLPLHSARGGVPLEAVTSPSFQELNSAFSSPSFSGE